MKATAADLTLGDLVAFGQILVRTTEQRPRDARFARAGRETEPWKVWADKSVAHLFAPARYKRPDGRLEGIVMGTRTLQNGPVEWGSYEDPTVFYPREAGDRRPGGLEPAPEARPSSPRPPGAVPMTDDHEPSTPLQQVAVEHHEMFTAWMAAGFTENQALQLLANYMAANGRE